MLTTLVLSALLPAAEVNKDLAKSAKEILAISLPARIGSFEAKEPKVESSKVTFSAEKSKDLFGRTLSEGWVHRFKVRRMGEGAANKGAMFQIGVAYLPTPDHAKLDAMLAMSGASRAKWPEPGLPDRTKDSAKTFGADQVWAWTGNTGWSAQIRVNRAVVSVNLTASRAAGKDNPRAFTHEDLVEWRSYIAKVVAKVKASPLNK